MARVFIAENRAISSENVLKKMTPSMPVTRRGRSCFGCKQEGHFVPDCPRKCGDVASGGPEQGNAPVSHLTSDRVVRVLPRGDREIGC